MTKPINEKYSYKDFTQQDLSNRPVSEFNNTRIIGTCFFQDFPKSRIFPPGMVGAEFELCNLDNVDVEAGNTVSEKSSNRQMRFQNDLQYWIVDDQDKPIEPANIESVLMDDGNIDPAEIPEKYYREITIFGDDWDETFGRNIIPEDSIFREIPSIIEQKDLEFSVTIPFTLQEFKRVRRVCKIRGEAWLYIGQKEGR